MTMFAFIKAFWNYRPAEFESTIDRWERKGLLRQIDQPEQARCSTKPPVGLVDGVLKQLEKLSAARARISGSRQPNRWRLRRLYRWQQRELDQSGPREFWDDVAKSSPTLS